MNRGLNRRLIFSDKKDYTLSLKQVLHGVYFLTNNIPAALQQMAVLKK